MVNMDKAIFVLVFLVLLVKMELKQIVDIKLNDAEKALFAKSAEAVRNMNADLKAVLVIIKNKI